MKGSAQLAGAAPLRARCSNIMSGSSETVTELCRHPGEEAGILTVMCVVQSNASCLGFPREPLKTEFKWKKGYRMAASGSVRPRRCQLILQAVCLK